MKKYSKKTFLRFRAFTLIELLVVIAIMTALVSILVPSLSKARNFARMVIDMSNLRQTGMGLIFYADASDGYMMPSVEASTNTYWWGKIDSNGVDHEKGFLFPYLQSSLKKGGLYECPLQRLGTYQLQGKPASEPDSEKWITSTYGYNGYYLSSPKSGWPLNNRPWNKMTTIKTPSQVIAFADSMIYWDSGGTGPNLKNTALLDPPYILSASGVYWQKNSYPTTSFRHDGKTNAVFADGHCDSLGLEGGELTQEEEKIGYAGRNNAPYYVPDYQEWIR